MCLPFSRLNGNWMVTEMRLYSTFPVTIQSPFSHHSVTIQSTERYFILCLYVKLLKIEVCLSYRDQYILPDYFFVFYSEWIVCVRMPSRVQRNKLFRSDIEIIFARMSARVPQFKLLRVVSLSFLWRQMSRNLWLWREQLVTGSWSPNNNYFLKKKWIV